VLQTIGETPAAIDTKLRACGLSKLRVRDVCHGDRLAGHAGRHDTPPMDIGLIADNICNLLTITSRQAAIGSGASRDLQREVLLKYIRRQASDPMLSLNVAARQLHMSTPSERRTVPFSRKAIIRGSI
jgi:hypothetical protein